MSRYRWLALLLILLAVPVDAGVLTLRNVKGAPISNAEFDANFSELYSAVAHGFVAGDLVYKSSATAWAKAISTAASTYADGVVVAVPNADTAYIATKFGQPFTRTSHGLGAAGTVVYLSASVAGTMTASVTDQIVGQVLDSNTVLLGALAATAVAGGSGDITDVWTDTTGGVDALTAAAGDSLDASAADSTVPWKVNATAVPTVEGQAIWESDANRLAVGDGAATLFIYSGLHAASVSDGGPATTATALAANGANCGAGNYPLGVDASGAVEDCTAAGGVTDHGALTGLADDDHTQYALLAGRAVGQTLNGDTDSGGNFTISPTAHATKGQILFDVGAGSAALPSISFSGDPDTGIRNAVANRLYFTTAANDRWFIDSGGDFREAAAATGSVSMGIGASSATDPAYAYNGDTDTGMGRGGADDTRLIAGAQSIIGAALVSSVKQATMYGLLIESEQAVTCTDNGTGANATLNITPTASTVSVTSQDAQGCDVTLVETGAVTGEVVDFIVVSLTAGAVNFADTAGVSELAGAFAAGLGDVLSVKYNTTLSAFLETSRSNN